MSRNGPGPTARRRMTGAEPIPLHWELHRLGIRGQDLAAAVGVSESWIVHIRHGLPASPQLRRRIAKYVGMPEHELFEVQQ